jgi:spore maturation protein CgeB
MKIVLFCHSLLSDWNHGNAHFVRGVVTELQARGHDVTAYEPHNAWSLENLHREPSGRAALDGLHCVYPTLSRAIRQYDTETLDLDVTLNGADLVLVHEWSDHDLVRRIGSIGREVGAGTPCFSTIRTTVR